VFSTPGADGDDSISAWLPDQRILFSADLFGPTTFPMWPNLTTIRGEWFRPPLPYLDSLEAVIALEPELILPGHFGPHRGKEENLRKLRLQRDSLQYVHDQVIEGMSAGKTVYELMDEIKLPKELAVPQNHGKVSWTVRGIWEYYADWFHFDATSPLYPIAPSAVYLEIVEMAGGAGAVASQANVLLEQGDVLRALLLVEMAEAADPTNAKVIATVRAVTEELIRRAGADPLTTNFSELLWLRAKLREREPPAKQ
jgi:alkyl sulfatase BDS1-like metallo-beta-lactamase superfamily hydrolase